MFPENIYTKKGRIDVFLDKAIQNIPIGFEYLYILIFIVLVTYENSGRSVHRLLLSSLSITDK